MSDDVVELMTGEEWKQAWPVLAELRKDLTLAGFLFQRQPLLSSGYRLFALFKDGEIVSVAGIVIHPHVTRQKDFWVHDLVTAEHARSKGYGLELMRFLEQLAADNGCTRLCVHTRAEREEARRFYEQKAGYKEYAIVYVQDLQQRDILLS